MNVLDKFFCYYKVLLEFLSEEEFLELLYHSDLPDISDDSNNVRSSISEEGNEKDSIPHDDEEDLVIQTSTSRTLRKKKHTISI